MFQGEGSQHAHAALSLHVSAASSLRLRMTTDEHVVEEPLHFEIPVVSQRIIHRRNELSFEIARTQIPIRYATRLSRTETTS